MLRACAIALSLGSIGGACAHTVSRPNPAGPPPRRDLPYAGRVVLASPALREQTEGFELAWNRRLQILGVTAHITYDDDRAVFDLYGLPPEALARIAGALVDPGGWSLDHARADGFVMTWLPPNATCDCSGRVRVAIDPHLLCGMLYEQHAVERPGARTELRGHVRWRARVGDTEIDTERPAETHACPDKDVWPASIVLELPRGLSTEAGTGVVLALAGGSLPAAPRIEAVTPSTGSVR